MKTKYKIRPLLVYILLTIMAFFSFAIAFYCLIFIVSLSISISLFFLCLSITTLFLIFGGLKIKSIKISESKIVLKQIFGLIYHKYAFAEIIGFKSNILINKNGKHLQLLIKTNTDKVIEINELLISNICEIEKEIKKTVRFDNSINEPIIDFKDKALILFTICFIICFIWFLISIF